VVENRHPEPKPQNGETSDDSAVFRCAALDSNQAPPIISHKNCRSNKGFLFFSRESTLPHPQRALRLSSGYKRGIHDR
jgi:hypothetical protein